MGWSFPSLRSSAKRIEREEAIRNRKEEDEERMGAAAATAMGAETATATANCSDLLQPPATTPPSPGTGIQATWKISQGFSCFYLILFMVWSEPVQTVEPNWSKPCGWFQQGIAPRGLFIIDKGVLDFIFQQLLFCHIFTKALR